MSLSLKPVKVLIVDDSALVRASLQKQLQGQPGVEIVGMAPDPFVARTILLKEGPDVVLLDIEMPRMDGLTFLRKIMRFRPTPVLVISSVTPKGSRTAIDCLEAGAVDVLCKPSSAYSIDELGGQILRWIEVIGKRGAANVARKQQAIAKLPEESANITTTNKIVAIGSSAGGPETLRGFLAALPRSSPGMVLVQHMGPVFLQQMAESLDKQSRIAVKLAAEGDSVIPGRCLLAPGDMHMTMKRTGARYSVHLANGPLVCGHKPAVDKLFHSVAEVAGANAMGVILTGMGNDGAVGMKAMHDAGAYCVAQDEATSVVYGMPARAVEAGGVDSVQPVQQIPTSIVEFGKGARKRSA